MEVKAFESSMTSAWDKFVDEDQESTIFHRAAWGRAIEDSSRLQSRYLCAFQENRVTGIMPLILATSPLFGRNLISTPFCMRGGPLGSEEAKSALLEHALALGKELRVNTVEIRAPSRIADGVEVSQTHCYFTKPISKDNDENLKAIPRKQRAMVRKGIKAGLVGKVESSLDTFFKIYSASVRNHGTPIFSRAYFLNLKELFGDDCEIITVYKDNVALSSVMSFKYRNIIMPYYGGGLPEARHHKAFDFMYWAVMQRAADEGSEIFDYGRSKIGSGSYSFKKNWGFEPEPMRYTFALMSGAHVPNRNPSSEKYKMAIAAWKKLPVPIANRIGPIIAPYFA